MVQTPYGLLGGYCLRLETLASTYRSVRCHSPKYKVFYKTPQIKGRIYSIVSVGLWVCVCWSMGLCPLVHGFVSVGLWVCVRWSMGLCPLVYRFVSVGLSVCVCWSIGFSAAKLSTLKKEASGYSETSVGLYETSASNFFSRSNSGQPVGSELRCRRAVCLSVLPPLQLTHLVSCGAGGLSVCLSCRHCSSHIYSAAVQEGCLSVCLAVIAAHTFPLQMKAANSSETCVTESSRLQDGISTFTVTITFNVTTRTDN